MPGVCYPLKNDSKQWVWSLNCVAQGLKHTWLMSHLSVRYPLKPQIALKEILWRLPTLNKPTWSSSYTWIPEKLKKIYIQKAKFNAINTSVKEYIHVKIHPPCMDTKELSRVLKCTTFLKLSFWIWRASLVLRTWKEIRWRLISIEEPQQYSTNLYALLKRLLP